MADPGLLQASGAQPKNATHFIPLSTQHFFSGLWSNRSPFNGPDSRYYTRFYGVRTDMLIDGSNMELTNYGTYIRRPGLLPYSVATLSEQVMSFYAFRQIASIPNPIDVIVDTQKAVYTLTPLAATQVFSKQAAEIGQQCFFQNVGNTLYMGTGTRALAWADPTVTQNNQGVRKWGIDIGPFTGASGPNFPGSAADVSASGVTSIVLQYGNSITLYSDGTNVHYQPGIVCTTPGTYATTDYTIVIGDANTLVTCNNSGGMTVTMPNLGSGASPFIVSVKNVGTGAVTVQRSTPTNTLSNGVPWTNASTITTGTGGPASVQVGCIQNGDTGYKFPTAAIDYLQEWTNPSAAEVEDGICTAVALQPSSISSPLEVSGFGFNIPSYAKITGITVGIKCYQGNYGVSGYPSIHARLITLLGVGNNTGHCDGGSNPWPASLTWNSYGGDLWGATSLTPDLINSSSFGVSLVCDATGGPATKTNNGYVDAIKVEVFYTVPASNMSDLLEGTNFGFDISSPTVVKGIQIQIYGYQDSSNPSGCYLTAQLMLNGQPTGDVRQLQLPTSIGTKTSGDSGDFWGLKNLSPADVGGVGFGVALQVFNPSISTLATFYITWVKIVIWATGGPAITVDTSNGTFTAISGFQYVAAYGNSLSKHVSSGTPSSAGTGAFTNCKQVKITVIAPTDTQVDQVWLFRTTDGGSTFLNMPDSPYLCKDLWPSGWSGGESAEIDDTATDASLSVTQPAPIDDINNPPPAGIVKMAYHLGRVWGAVGNMLYYSSGPDCLVGNGAEAFPPLNYFTFPTQINRLVPTSSSLLVFTESDLYYIAGATLDSMYPMPMLTGLGLRSYNALAMEGVNTWLYSADRQFIRFSAAGINEDGFAIGDRLEMDPAYNPSSVYVASLISGSSDKAVFIADGSSTWYRCNWNQPPEGGPAWSPKATFFAGPTMSGITTVAGSSSTWTYTYTTLTGNPINVGDSVTVTGMTNSGNNGTFPVTAIGTKNFTVTNANGAAATTESGSGYVTPKTSYTAIGSVETAPGVHQLLVGVWDSYAGKATVAYRTPPGKSGTFSDLNLSYTCSIILGSLVLAQPGQMAEVESFTVELPNIGSIPTMGVLLDEVYDYLNPSRVSFEILPNSVNDPPVLTASTSIMSKRFYLLQGAVPVIGRHIQMQISFPAEAVRNELYTLSVWGSLHGREG